MTFYRSLLKCSCRGLVLLGWVFFSEQFFFLIFDLRAGGRMVGCSAAKGAAPYKKFIRIAVFCLQCIYLGIGVCNCILHKVHIFYSSMEMSRVHFIFGLYWAGQIVYSRAAPLPRIKVIYTNCLCLYNKRRDFFVFFFSPPWNSLSNTVAERRAKGLSMDALTPPTIAHNGCLLHCLHHHRHIEI